jgi:hypothetical protein
MVEVEIRTPRHNEEAQTIAWKQLALVRADSEGVKVYGDPSCVPDDSVISATTGKEIHMASCPEEWARNLPDAYRAGDLVAVIIHDDDPAEIEESADITEPTIPDSSAFSENAHTEAVEA